MSANPYVVGQWVRGPRFYGREPLIRDLLENPRNVLWVLGTRRMGKTSLLKELELRTSQGERFFPLFWDFQGASSPAELHEVFEEALVDAEERLEQLELSPRQIMGDDVFESILSLRRHLREKKLDLFLLCDEVEELLSLARTEPNFLARLRRTLHRGLGLRTVLASTIRLWGLMETGGDTSPFLHGCEPPLYLRCLTDESASALIRQEKLASSSRPAIQVAEVRRIREVTGNHPYLVQLLCKRFLEAGELTPALSEVDRDPMVGYFFTVDFEMLDEVAQELLLSLVETGSGDAEGLAGRLGISSEALRGVAQQLEALGYLRFQGRIMELRSFFFRRWAQRRLRGQEHRPAFALTRAGRAVAAEALDRLALGVILVAEDLRIVFSNRSARELLDRGDGLVERAGKLYAANDPETRELRGAVAAAAGQDGKGGGLRLGGLSEEEPQSVVVMPLESQAVPESESSVAAVFVSGPGRPVDSSDQVLRSIYRLTRAEARLALEILAGHSLDQAAVRLGVSINTARTHMRRVLAKTNTHRQGEFIRLVLNGPLAWVDSRD